MPDDIERRLREAEEALHRLQTGSQFTRVRLSDGSETEFSAPKINELHAYVARLRDELAGLRRERGAVGFIF